MSEPRTSFRPSIRSLPAGAALPDAGWIHCLSVRTCIHSFNSISKLSACHLAQMCNELPQAQRALMFLLLGEIFLRVLSCPLRLRQALHWALGSVVVGMEFLPLWRSQSGRAERLLRAAAVSLVPELSGPYSVKNGGSCGKRRSLRVCFRDRGVLDKRGGGISMSKGKEVRANMPYLGASYSWTAADNMWLRFRCLSFIRPKPVISHPKPVLLNSLFPFVALLPTLLSKLGIFHLCFLSPLLHSLA